MSGMEKKLDPLMLESDIMQFVEVTKVKLSSLLEEISQLRLENEQIQKIVRRTQEETEDNAVLLAESQERAKIAQANYDTLLQLRKKREDDLKGKRIQLGEELDNAEKANEEMKMKSKKLAESEKQMKMNRKMESNANQKKLGAIRKNAELLTEMIGVRNNEIVKLEAELNGINEKQNSRLNTLKTEKAKLMAMFSK